MSNDEVKPTEGDGDEATPAKKPAAARKPATAKRSPAGEAAPAGPAGEKAAPARRATAAKKVGGEPKVAPADDDAPTAQATEKSAAAVRSTAAPKRTTAARVAAAPSSADGAPVEPPAAAAKADADVPVAPPTVDTAVEEPETPPAILPDLPAASSGDRRREYRGTGRRVVVAEDEALIRLDVVETLSEAGFDVVGEAGDGEKAVALATDLRPDVVVMDIKMPILDGISAAERIGKARIAPVVLLTAFSQAELVERARDAGAMAYVVKPFTPAELLPAIEIAIARHQEITALEAEVADLAERFETRKRVERAKGLLQSKMGLTEPESFRWIQKTSMDRRLTMREVADAVIDQVGNGDKSR